MAKLSETASGPLPDRRSSEDPNNEIEKSYNNKYCKQYFEPPIIRESFYYYDKFLFANPDCTILCKKFGFRCCEGEHMSFCNQNWTLLEEYINYSMLKEIDIEPWSPKEDIEPCSPGEFIYGLTADEVPGYFIDEIPQFGIK